MLGLCEEPPPSSSLQSSPSSHLSCIPSALPGFLACPPGIQSPSRTMARLLQLLQSALLLCTHVDLLFSAPRSWPHLVTPLTLGRPEVGKVTRLWQKQERKQLGRAASPNDGLLQGFAQATEQMVAATAFGVSHHSHSSSDFPTHLHLHRS